MSSKPSISPEDRDDLAALIMASFNARIHQHVCGDGYLAAVDVTAEADRALWTRFYALLGTDETVSRPPMQLAERALQVVTFG